jgi:hypothetical protein
MQEKTHLKIVAPQRMEVKIAEGMKPLPKKQARLVQKAIIKMRAEGMSDHSIQMFFKHNYKVELIYV